MPADSTATSVPAPIAIPTSAVASAGASLTPSPTIATFRPPGLEAPDGLGLVGRAGPGRRPRRSRAARATDVGDRLRVAGDHRDPEAHRVEALDRLGRLGPDLVLERRARRARDRRRRRGGPSGRRGAQRARPPGPASRPRSASRRGPPTATVRPSTVARAPRPASASKPAAGSRLDAACRGARDDRPRQRVLGVGLDRRGEPRAARRSSAGGRGHGRQDRLAQGERPGLVEDDDVELAGALERQAVLDQQPVAGAERGRDRDHQRDRQARARAGRR